MRDENSAEIAKWEKTLSNPKLARITDFTLSREELSRIIEIARKPSTSQIEHLVSALMKIAPLETVALRSAINAKLGESDKAFEDFISALRASDNGPPRDVGHARG